MDVVLEAIYKVGVETSFIVSILVLVDVVLEELLYRFSRWHKVSFNPCFGGCCSGSQDAAFVLPCILGFNPCFGGCCSGRLFC